MRGMDVVGQARPFLRRETPEGARRPIYMLALAMSAKIDGEAQVSFLLRSSRKCGPLGTVRAQRMQQDDTRRAGGRWEKCGRGKREPVRGGNRQGDFARGGAPRGCTRSKTAGQELAPSVTQNETVGPVDERRGGEPARFSSPESPLPQEALELHGERHVALNLQFAREKRHLAVQLPAHEVQVVLG